MAHNTNSPVTKARRKAGKHTIHGLQPLEHAGSKRNGCFINIHRSMVLRGLIPIWARFQKKARGILRNNGNALSGIEG